MVGMVRPETGFRFRDHADGQQYHGLEMLAVRAWKTTRHCRAFDEKTIENKDNSIIWIKTYCSPATLLNDHITQT
jgi:hypothetical protein